VNDHHHARGKAKLAQIGGQVLAGAQASRGQDRLFATHAMLPSIKPS
jgi:hypothetical protein